MSSNKKRSYHSFTENNLLKACEDVREKKLSLRKAAEKYGVSKSIIDRKLKNQHQGAYGRPTILSKADEDIITECISIARKWGFPLTRYDIRCIVKKHLDKKGIRAARLKDNMPGRQWMHLYLKRQLKLLKNRLCQNIKWARAGVSKETIEEYFKALTESLTDVAPEVIVNYDETSLQDDPGKQKVIVRRTCKYPERIFDHSKTNVSIMFAGTAHGHMLPVYVVYKSEHLYESWVEGVPKGAHYNRSKSGWFEGAIFEDWFLNVALKYFRKLGNQEKIIIGDNLASHISVNVLQKCRENNIHFVLLPPNSTHFMQPLDLAFFSPLKTMWRHVLSHWKLKNRGALTKDKFPQLLKKTIDGIEPNVCANLKAGFRTAGICHLDGNKELQKLLHIEDQPNGEEWVASFEEFMSESGKKETQAKVQRKRIKPVPGRTLTDPKVMQELELVQQKKNGKTHTTSNLTETSSTLLNLDEPSTSKITNKTTAKKNKKKSMSDDSSDSDSFSLHNSTDDEDFSDFLREMDCDKVDVVAGNDSEKDETVASSETGNSALEIDLFIVVCLVYDKGSKRESVKKLLGRVEDLQEEKMTVKCMRTYKGSDNTFIFPDVDDVLEIDATSAIKKRTCERS